MAGVRGFYFFCRGAVCRRKVGSGRNEPWRHGPHGVQAGMDKAPTAQRGPWLLLDQQSPRRGDLCAYLNVAAAAHRSLMLVSKYVADRAAPSASQAFSHSPPPSYGSILIEYRSPPPCTACGA